MSRHRALQLAAVVLIVVFLAWTSPGVRSLSPGAGSSRSTDLPVASAPLAKLASRAGNGPHAGFGSLDALSLRSTVPRPSLLGTVINVSVGSAPGALLYENESGYVYVANSNSANVTVLLGSTDVGTAPVDLNPTAMAFDSVDHYVYVANYGSNLVDLITGSNLIGGYAVGTNPDAVVFDPGHGFVDVANELSNTVTVLNSSGFVTNVPVGRAPFAEAYDPSNGLVYVADYGAANVTVLNGTSVVATIGVGFSPVALSYDAANEQVYVANWNSANVSVINGTSLVATVPVGSLPWALSYDSTNGYVYVANENSNNVSVLRGSAVVGSVPVGTFPKALATDTGSGEVYVANWGSNNTSVIRGTVLLGSLPVGGNPDAVAFDGGNGEVYVANSASNTVSVISPTLPLTFQESGLPSGTNWSVSVNGSVESSTTSSLVFSEPNGNYSYTVGSVLGYVANRTSGSVTLNGSAASVPITFTRTSEPAYPVSFTESGLPSGTSWSVTWNGSTNSSTASTIGFTASNGTYNYSVGTVQGYTVSPSYGRATIHGASLRVSVKYVRAYAVNFDQTGLPSGMTWDVVLNGSQTNSTGTTVTFTVPNGTYRFTVGAPPGYGPSPSSGSVGVAGQTVNVPILKARAAPPSTYTFKFDELGLPSGTTWSVALNGTRQSSSNSTVSFTEPNGSYAFTVGGVPGYSASPASGSISVSGSAVGTPIAFATLSSTRYTATFVESGLPAGTSWSVTLNGSRQSSTSSTLVFSEPNYTYSYTIGTVPGYGSNVTSGSVKVAGSAKTVYVAFTPSRTGGGGSPTNGFGTTDWIILAAAIALVGAAGLAFAMRRRRRREPPGPPSQGTGGPPQKEG